VVERRAHVPSVTRRRRAGPDVPSLNRDYLVAALVSDQNVHGYKLGARHQSTSPGTAYLKG
jgi:hypothetical protein